MQQTPLLDNRQLGRTVQRQNVLTNGGFEVWQRGPGPFGNNVYTADRWLMQWAAGFNGSVWISEHAPAGSRYSLAFVVTTAGDSGYVVQWVEHWRELRGRTVSASVLIWQAAPNAIRVAINDAVTHTWSEMSPDVNAWTRLTVTANVAPTATHYMFIIYALQAGTHYVDNATLVVGSQPADYVPLHPAEDLARCERYYETFRTDGANPMWLATGTTTPALWGPYVPYRVQKAVTPTVTFQTTFTTQIGGGAAIGISAMGAGSTVDGYRISAGTAAAVTNGQLYVVLPQGAPANGIMVSEANP